MDVMQARWGSHGDLNAVVFSPSTVQECFNLTIVAVNWAERLRVPVIILSDAALGNMEEIIRIPDSGDVQIINRKKPRVEPNAYKCYMPDPDDLVPPMAELGGPYRSHISSLIHLDNGYACFKPEAIDGLVKRLFLKVERHKKQLTLFEELHTENADICVIAYGTTARSAKAAVKAAREKGIKAGLFRLISIWPFPYEQVEKIVENSKAIVVAEMNMGQISGEIEKVNKSDKKIVQVNRIDGRLIKPNQILQKIEEASTNYG
jgi:2-oxoglutarate ferredoxin oxidoreductase subunit alpha